MGRWVIDASSVVDLLSAGAASEATWNVIGTDPLHAPDVLTAEVASALARRGRAGVPGVDAAMAEFAVMPLTVHDSRALLLAAWRHRHTLRVTDAFYVELARSLSLPLVTADGRLGRAVRQQSLCDVVLIE